MLAARSPVRALPARRKQRAVAAVELALILPVLLLLALGVFDYARALQFNNVLVSLSREGANLAARTSEPPEYIMRVLQSTASPLRMNTDGRMYIVRVVGRADGRGDVDLVARAAQGDAGLQSRTYSCTSWRADNTCNLPMPRPIVSLPVVLQPGETVFVAEAMYDYTSVIRYVMPLPPVLYARTIL